MTIEDVPAGRLVALTHLDLRPPSGSLAGPVSILETAGTVRFSHCVFRRGVSTWDEQPSLYLVQAEDVTLLHCTLFGGYGHGPLSSGLFAFESKFAMYGGYYQAAQGTSYEWGASGYGSPGLHLQLRARSSRKSRSWAAPEATLATERPAAAVTELGSSSGVKCSRSRRRLQSVHLGLATARAWAIATVTPDLRGSPW